jgi:hypothetical protein
MTWTSDPFADLADWLGRPVSIPVRGEDRGPTPEHAKAAAQHLLAVDTILRRAFEHHAQNAAGEVADRLRVLAVALRQWAAKYSDDS